MTTQDNVIERAGNDLIIDGGGVTFPDFYQRLEVDPFYAGVNYGSNEPMAFTDVMDFSNTSVLFALHNFSRFQAAVDDTEVRHRFEHGWMAAFALSTGFAFDEREDTQRRLGIACALETADLDLTPDLLDATLTIEKYIKRGEFTELQRGMRIFSATKTWAADFDTDNHDGYTNLLSTIGMLRILIRGPHEREEPIIDDMQLDSAAVMLADEHARRSTAAFRIGFASMLHESEKTSLYSSNPTT